MQFYDSVISPQGTLQLAMPIGKLGERWEKVQLLTHRFEAQYQNTKEQSQCKIKLEKSLAEKLCLKGVNLFLDNSVYLIKHLMIPYPNKSVAFCWSM